MPNKNILIIEDDKSSAFAYNVFLSKSGFPVSLADSIAQAKQLYQSQQFGAAIIDLSLPDGDAIEMIKDLKANQQSVLALVISGRGDKELKKRAAESGADRYLIKPVDFGELKEYLAEKLNT